VPFHKIEIAFVENFLQRESDLLNGARARFVTPSPLLCLPRASVILNAGRLGIGSRRRSKSVTPCDAATETSDFVSIRPGGQGLSPRKSLPICGKVSGAQTDSAGLAPQLLTSAMSIRSASLLMAASFLFYVCLVSPPASAALRSFDAIGSRHSLERKSNFQRGSSSARTFLHECRAERLFCSGRILRQSQRA
jgi:hypothetical protein